MTKEQTQTIDYYDERFARLTKRTQNALRNIELECEYIREVHQVMEEELNGKTNMLK